MTHETVVTLLDEHLVRQHCSMLGPDKFMRLLDQLEQQCHQLTEKMAQAYANQDIEAVQRFAHQLAGAAANFGLHSLAEQCKAIEVDKEAITSTTCDQLETLVTTGLAALRQFSQQSEIS